ncbi:MAG: hypothetical protein AAF713_03570 [Pseudomonadota bacterium]
MAQYAVIGWGSLIWDLDDLAPNVAGPWRMAAGPRLPVEFARVSRKRRGALALCLEERIGAPCATHVIASRRDGIGDAAADLAARERSPEEWIGAVCLASGHRHGSRPAVIDSVAAWCRDTGWAGAVWTDLPENFAAETGAPFTLDRAVAYLRTLRGDGLAEAVRYIEEAPLETATPLRTRLGADPWWQGLALARPR